MKTRRTRTCPVPNDAAGPFVGSSTGARASDEDASDPTGSSRARYGRHWGRLTAPVIGVFVALIAALGLSGCGAPIVLQGQLTRTDATTAAVGVEVAVFDSVTQTEVAHTYSNADGAYSFDADALPAGTYRLRFSATDWWHDATTWAAATPVPVTTGSATVIDESLTPATGSVSGTVTASDGTNTLPLSDATVEAISVPLNRSIASTTSEEDGAWSMTALPPATYHFRFSYPRGTTRYNGSSPTPGDAPDVVVTAAGTVTGVDAQLIEESKLSGTVTDGYRQVPGLFVIAYGSDGSVAGLASTSSTDVGNEGLFELTGLENLGYQIQIIDPSRHLQPLRWGSPDSDLFGGLAVDPGPAPGSNVGVAAMKGADCDSATFVAHADLSSVTLENTSLVNCTLSGDDLSGRSLAHADLTAADLSGADLTGADLTGANLSGADLTGATLTGATLTGTDFTDATLTGVVSGNIVGSPAALPTGWVVIDGTLVQQVDAPITWVAPAPISYGTALSATQLDASSSVPGTFSYAPAPGTVLEPGRHTLSTTFTPTDPNASLVTTASVEITVGPAVTATALTTSGTGRPATLTAAVTVPVAATLTPTGTVQFIDGSTVLGTQTIDGSGTAQITVTLTPGTHTLTASFQGSTDFAASVSGEAPIVVADNCLTPAGPGVDWGGCDLSSRDLIGVDFTGADLSGTNLTGTDLTDATLTGVSSGGISGTPAGLPTAWKLINGYLVGPGADLEGAVLTYNDPHFSVRFDLSGVDLSDANLRGANLNGSEIWSARLAGADLTGANLYGTDIRYSDLTGVTLTGANVDSVLLSYNTLTGVISGGLTGTPFQINMLDGSNWHVVAGYLIGRGANLSHADLTSFELAGVDFEGVDLTGANLSNLDLTGAGFTNATLADTRLTGATLTGVTSGGIDGTPLDLPTGWHLTGGYLVGPGADLAGANLAGQDLTGQDLAGADLSGATLTGANVTGTQLATAMLTGVTSGGLTGTPAGLPPGMTIANGYLVGTGVDLHGVSFAGADLTGVDFSGSDLSGASFVGADLTGVDFSGSDLSGASLVGATLTGADFTGADLTGVASSGVLGAPGALPTGWLLWNGRLIGPGTDLSGLDLTGVDLSDIDLSSANLTGAKLVNTDLAGAKLTGATLTGVSSSGIVGTPASLPTGFVVTDGFLIGDGVDLAGADLTGITTTGVTFVNADLTNANLSGLGLSGVSFGNASLQGTKFHQSDLDGVDLSHRDLSGGDLSGASLQGANLVGARIWNADLAGVDLTGANLWNADIRNSNLTNAILTNVNFAGSGGQGTLLLYDTLTGIVSGGITGAPAQISMSDGTNWQVVNGYLVQV